MTLESFINRLTQYCSLLYTRQWERWELLTIAAVAMILLLLVMRGRRKVRFRRTSAHHLYERSPIIGVRLAQRRGSR